MSNIIVLLFLFMLGASFGSFLSVVIYRLHAKKKGIVFGHSICPECKFELEFVDMIPVFSYALLRGKCRKCKKTIPGQYLLLELSCGLLFVAIYFLYPFLTFAGDSVTFAGEMFVPFLFNSIYSVFLIGILFYDLRTSTIPDVFLFPLLGAAALGTLATGADLLDHVIIAPLIALAFFGGQIFFSKGKWLGEGDLYLSLSLAVIFGWKLFIVCVVASYILGAVISLVLLLSKKIGRKTQIPFGPFLVIGAFTTLFFGTEILSWYLGSLAI